MADLTAANQATNTVSFNTGETALLTVSGSFTATIVLERALQTDGPFVTVASVTTATTATHLNTDTQPYFYRGRCSAYTTGTATVTVAEQAGQVINSWADSNDTTRLEVIDGGVKVTGTMTQTGAVTITGNTQQTGTLTVGVDDTGHDVKFFGATSGKYWLWDESADGVVQYGTQTFGVNDTGYDVKMFGATAGKYWLWDESADAVVLVGNEGITGDLKATNIDAGASGEAGTVDVFPTTASKGKLAISCTDQTGNTTVSLVTGAMGQATTVNLPDPGASASYLMQSTAQVTLAEADLLDGASTANANASKAAVLDANKLLVTTANIGAVNTGVTAVEYGDGIHHTTVLTVSQADALTLGDSVALADGYLLYTFPAGRIVVNSASMSMAVSAADATLQSDTPDVGLGTTIGTGAVALLDGTAAFENIITGQTATNCNGTASVVTIANQPLAIAAGGDHTVHFNVADTWGNGDTDFTADIAGTVYLSWTFHG